MSGLYKDNELQGVHPSHLIMKSTITANRPDVVGLAVPGTQDDEPAWQVSKLTWDATSGELTQRLFAQKNGVETNGFVFTWDAVAHEQEIKLNGFLIAGNTISIDVDGATVSQAFNTDHDTTMSLWAAAIAAKSAIAQVQTLTTDADLITGNTYNTTVDGGTPIATPFNTSNDQTLADHAAALAAEPGIATAVVTDAGSNDREIVITAAVAGVPVVLSNFSITGGASQALITQNETTANSVGVSTATVRTPNSLAVEVVAAVAGEPLALTNAVVTGTNINTQIRIEETTPNQGAASGLTFGPV